MKRRRPSLQAIVFSFLVAARAGEYSCQEPFTRTGPFDSTGTIGDGRASLEAGCVNGSVNIERQ